MPLRKGSSREVIEANIKELVAAGHEQKQAEAIAYREAGMSRDGRPLINVGDRAMTYFTTEELGEHRSLTPEGFLICQDVPIARVGSQTYRESELMGKVKGDGAGQIVVSRLPDEVFSEETLASFEDKPVTVEHPNVFVNPDNYSRLAVGHTSNIRRGKGLESDLVLADLVITDPGAIAHVNRDLPQVSCGYGAEYEQTEPGKANQREIRGNHVALVTRGRAGMRCAIKDHSHEVLDMSNATTAPGHFGRLARFVQAAIKGDQVTVDALTRDAEKEEREAVKEGEKAEVGDAMKAIRDCLGEMAKDVKMSRDWQDAYDKRVRDAEEKAAAEKKTAEEEAEKQKAKDALLTAEVLPQTVEVGKVWLGDSVAPALREILSRAEILAPGIKPVTTDAPSGDSIGQFMRAALVQAHATVATKDSVETFLMGRPLDTVKGRELTAVFNGASALVRQRNNHRSAVRSAAVRTGDGGHSVPTSISDINKQNEKFWADQAAAR